MNPSFAATLPPPSATNGQPASTGQCRPRAAFLLTTVLICTFVLSRPCAAQSLGFQPSQQALALAVWVHACKCVWKFQGAVPANEPKVARDVVVEAVKWLPKEKAVELTLRFAEGLNDAKVYKEWAYTGKWKVQNSGVLGMGTWSVAQEAAALAAVHRPGAVPLTSPTVPHLPTP